MWCVAAVLVSMYLASRYYSLACRDVRLCAVQHGFELRELTVRASNWHCWSSGPTAASRLIVKLHASDTTVAPAAPLVATTATTTDHLTTCGHALWICRSLWIHSPFSIVPRCGLCSVPSLLTLCLD